MSIIVEDGTGLSTAQTYASVATADAYHLARNNTTWTGTDAVKEYALVRAAQALDGRYAQYWPGYRYSEDQALDWPRTDAVDTDGYDLDALPQGIVDACCEAALIELVTAGSLSEESELGVKREKAGSVEVEYASTQRTGYPKIAHALRRIVRAGGLRMRRVV